MWSFRCPGPQGISLAEAAPPTHRLFAQGWPIWSIWQNSQDLQSALPPATGSTKILVSNLLRDRLTGNGDCQQAQEGTSGATRSRGPKYKTGLNFYL